MACYVITSICIYDISITSDGKIRELSLLYNYIHWIFDILFPSGLKQSKVFKVASVAITISLKGTVLSRSEQTFNGAWKIVVS